MVKVKVSQVTNTQLDWLVAKCEGYENNTPSSIRMAGWHNYTTDPAQMWPIIEREKIAISPLPDGLWRAYAPEGTQWVPCGELGLEVFKWKYRQEGYHPLIAAARCYVVSKLGEEVEIPEELYG